MHTESMKRKNQWNDELLMQKLSEGQLRFAGELFERYHLQVYNFYLYQTRNPELSEDLTQNVFERVIRYRATYRVGMPFKAWLFQIARNAKADYSKKNKMLYSDYTDLEALEADYPFSQVGRKADQVHILKKAMAQLEPEQRELLLLTRFQRLKYKEVAQLLHCSEGAVKVKVHRAIKQLKANYFKLEKL